MHGRHREIVETCCENQQSPGPFCVDHPWASLLRCKDERTIDLGELEANFDQLIAEAATGTTLVITRDGVAVAKLVPVPPARPIGFLAGTMPPFPDSDIFEPMTEEEQADWEEGPVFPGDSQTEPLPPPKREFGFLQGMYPPIPDADMFEPIMTDEELDE